MRSKKRRSIYVTNMGLLYRLTPKQWAAFKTASGSDWTDIDPYGELLGTVHNVTDWEPRDFRDCK